MQFTDEPRTHDHSSDPARTPGDGWVDEGGASHLGPATHFYPASEESAAQGADKAAEKAEGDEGQDSDDPERDLGRS